MLCAHLRAFSIPLCDLQAGQLQLSVPKGNTSLSARSGEMHRFHEVVRTQADSTHADGGLLLFRNLLHGKAQEEALMSLKHYGLLTLKYGHVLHLVSWSLVAATVRFITSNSPPSTTLIMPIFVVKITRQRFRSDWLQTLRSSSFVES